MLPCFQLLRIGGGRGGDLYTFHPPSRSGCTYRLGCRADLCDVALRPQQEPGLISGVHAELHAELQGDDWRVSLEDHSSQGKGEQAAPGWQQVWEPLGPCYLPPRVPVSLWRADKQDRSWSALHRTNLPSWFSSHRARRKAPSVKCHCGTF